MPERTSSGRHPLSIVIPAHGAADQLDRCLTSLALYADPEDRVYVIDDATPDDSVGAVVRRHALRIPRLGYLRNNANEGFVRTCNRGIREREDAASDVLLLNSDTELTEGALTEMQEVLYLNSRHAAVCPRSNAATLCTVPLGHETGADESYGIWRRIRDHLPRFSVVPTAVGFCMLVRSSIIDRFGSFDDVYSPGYNEENDLICRINRFGFSAVLAHRAFVFHYAGSSFGWRRRQLEARNARLLESRYPEYQRAVDDYFRYLADPVDRFAPAFVARRPKILYDLFHLEPTHCGTSQFGLTLLGHLCPLIESQCDLYVDVNRAALDFFGNQLVGYRIFDERHDTDVVFDLVYKPCQIFSWAEFNRMSRHSARVAFTLQDIIAVRCAYLSSASQHEIFRATAQLANHVFAISHAARLDFEAFFGLRTDIQVIHHGAGPVACEKLGSDHGDYVLLVGGRFDHKAVVPAVQALRGMRVKVLGGEPPFGFRKDDQVQWIKGGGLSAGEVTRLYAAARVVVYPTQYEGFGLPLIESCAMGKPVVVFDDPVMREVAGLLPGCEIQFVRRFEDLPAAVEEASKSCPAPAQHIRTWDDVAADYAAAFLSLLERDIDIELLRRRSDLLRILDSAGLCQ